MVNLRTLSTQERIRLVHQIYIEWPRQLKIMAELERAFEKVGYTSDPVCAAVFAKYGMGKSTILDLLRSLHPSKILKEKSIKPIVRANVPAKGTVNNLLISLLAAIGDPIPTAGTVGAKSNRLMGLIEDCETKMLLVDEGNHLVDINAQVLLYDLANELKNILKETNCGCILAGLPYTQEMLDANKQVGSLFGNAYKLEPFLFDNEFHEFLKAVEKLLPLDGRTVLEDTEMAWRCFCATGGRTRYMVNLVKEAAEHCIYNSKSHLDLDALSAGFERWIANEREGVPNPFIGAAPTEAIEIEDIYFPPRLKDTKRKSQK